MKRKKLGLRRLLVFLLAALLLLQPVLAADPDVILVYKTHLDVGFVDTAENMINRFRSTYIDTVLADFEANSDLPEYQQFKWTVPGWAMKKALEDWPGQTEERKEKISEAIRSGRLYTHALPHTFETESLDLESVVRGMVFASDVARDHGIDLPEAAKMSDVPSHSWAIPTILVNAGVKFLHLGCNDASTQPDVPLLFWWEGPDGSRLLTMYSYGYGSPATPTQQWKDEFGDFIHTYLGITTLNEAAAPTTQANVNQDIATLEAQGLTYRVGTLEDFADVLFKCDLSKLEVIRGDMPNTWIHGLMSAPNETRDARNLRPQLLTLESLETILALYGIDAPDSTQALADAYEDTLRFAEHTWGKNEHVEDYGSTFTNNLQNGAYNGYQSAWDEKLDLVDSAENAALPALKENADLLARSVQGDQERVVVYNALPWARDGVVSVPYSGNAPASLKNAETGELIPVTASGNMLTFTATDVPSMGYTTYLFSEEAPAAGALQVDREANTIENEFYKITLSPATGSITSVIDKTSGRELVAQSNQYGFSQYFNERYSNEEVLAYNKAYNTFQGGWAYDDMSKTGLNQAPYNTYPHVEDSPENLTLTFEESGQAVTAVMTAGASHPKPDANGVTGNTYDDMRLEITLYAGQPYIDVTWSMTGKAKDPWPMADWLAFPFAVDNPQYRLYRLGGVMNPETDIVTDTNVNVLALDGGVAITDPEGNGVALCSADSPLISIGKTGIWEFDKGEHAFNPQEPTVFLNLFNNQWDTNYPTWNGGDWSTSVRLWSINSYDQERDLVTPSREVRQPMTAAYSDETGGTLPAQKSGVELSEKGVIVTAFGPNIDGEGTILRLWEQAGRDVTCTVTLPEELQATSVQPVDLRGQELGHPIPVRGNQFTVSIGKNAPYSVRIDYERDIVTEPVAPVENLKAENSSTVPGNILVSWNAPAGYTVEVKATAGKDTVSVQEASEQGQAELSLEPATLYTISAVVIDARGTRSEARTTTIETSGSPVIPVAAATAGSSFSGYDPINTANGKGLTGRNPLTATHDNDTTAYSMWHTNLNPGANGYVIYDFGEARNLDKLYVWNMNQVSTSISDPDRLEAILKRGFKNVKIEYSLDGKEWTSLPAPEGMTFEDGSSDYPFQFAPGTGEAQMKATNLNDGKNTPISFNGVSARYVKLTAQSSWGNDLAVNDGKYWGLSEVMFTEDTTANSIVSVAPCAVETVAGVCPTLPETVEAAMEDETTRDVAVTWEAMDPTSYENPGSFTVKGQIYGYAGDVICTVTVNAALGADDTVTNATAQCAADEPAVTLTWEDPEAPFARILVRWSDGSKSRTETVEPGTETLTLTGLTPGAVYRFAISAEDVAGRTSDEVVCFARPEGTGILKAAGAEASSSWGGAINPMNTINGSGLTGEGLTATHDNNRDGESMWHIRQLVDGTAWITFDLGSVAKLDELYIWNMNQANNTARGMKAITIEYSTDNKTWTELGDFELAQASGENGISATNLNDDKNSPISFDGKNARYVKITATSSWGSANYWGLSEVMFTGEKTIAAVASAENATVSTMLGKAPKLPERVSVTYEDETTGTEFVAWDGFDPAQLDKAGTFTVTGKVALTEIPVECEVTVTPLPVDKSDLNKWIGVATGKPEAAYTAESWARLAKAFDAAVAVADDPDATQEAVDNACAALKSALDQLKLQVSLSSFRALLAEMERLQTEQAGNLYDTIDQAKDGQYDRAAYTRMIAALQKARAADKFLQDAEEGNLTDYQLERLSAVLPEMNDTVDAFLRSQYREPTGGGGTHHPVKPEQKPTEPSEPDGYTDVSVGDWYYDAVSYVSENGLMTGVGNGKFSPDGAVTRAMVWTVLARMAGEDTEGGSTWYSKAQAWAMETGVSDGSNPMASITREQLAAMLYRYAGSPAVDGNLSAYPDGNTVSDWAVDALVWATEEAIINGMGGRLSPKTGATRAQLAAMLMRFH